MSRRTQVAVGLGLAVALLYVFFRQADFGEVAAHLQRANYAMVGLAVVLTILINVYRAWRWYYLMLPLKSIGIRPLVECTMMGWAVTSLLPGRLGEVARPVLIGRKEGVSKTASFATIVLERMFDVVSVLLILAVYLVFFPPPPSLDTEAMSVLGALRASGLVALLLVGGVVAMIVGLELAPRRAEGWINGFFGLLPAPLSTRGLSLVKKFTTGLAGIRQPRLLALVGLHSIVLWTAIVVIYWLLFRALHLDVPYYAALPVVTVIVIGVMVPTPAAVGSFHAAAQIALVTLWGVPNDLAVSYAIISHVVAFVPVTLIGIVLLSREGLSLAALERLGERES